MALKLIINIAKKVPGPLEFSSLQASCSIEGEIAAGQDPVAESARLFAQAEKAVDAQLAGTHSQASPQVTASARVPQASSPTQASQPFRGNSQRRQPARCSAAQARYLRQLGDRNPGALNEALVRNGVSAIEELPAKVASATIDLILQGAA